MKKYRIIKISIISIILSIFTLNICNAQIGGKRLVCYLSNGKEDITFYFKNDAIDIYDSKYNRSLRGHLEGYNWNGWKKATTSLDSAHEEVGNVIFTAWRRIYEAGEVPYEPWIQVYEIYMLTFRGTFRGKTADLDSYIQSGPPKVYYYYSNLNIISNRLYSQRDLNNRNNGVNIKGNRAVLE